MAEPITRGDMIAWLEEAWHRFGDTTIPEALRSLLLEPDRRGEHTKAELLDLVFWLRANLKEKAQGTKEHFAIAGMIPIEDAPYDRREKNPWFCPECGSEYLGCCKEHIIRLDRREAPPRVVARQHPLHPDRVQYVPADLEEPQDARGEVCGASWVEGCGNCIYWKDGVCRNEPDEPMNTKDTDHCERYKTTHTIGQDARGEGEGEK